ncbi:MAG: MBL fold metallo-hydrolase [Alphaproteobacteria bacterium]|jgi:L-ascorbate metabolism protein UlaG (beta-lactamase superfamily)
MAGSVSRSAFRRIAAYPLAVLIGVALLAVAHGTAGATCQVIARAPAPQIARLQPVALTGAPKLPGFGLLRIADPAAGPSRHVDLTFLGHSSFLVASAQGVTTITDYNGYIRTGEPPTVVTMNHAHSTHFTDTVEPGVAHILRGWNTGEGIPRHDVEIADLRVRNVPTNIRDGFAGTEFAGNSIFIFETAGLCVAHLGHLHHQLEPGHILQIGLVDVLLAAIDDGWTMAQTGMVEVIETLRPSVVIPMHFSGPWLLEGFVGLMAERGWTMRAHDTPTVRLSRETLPRKTVLVLPPSGFF